MTDVEREELKAEFEMLAAGYPAACKMQLIYLDAEKKEWHAIHLENGEAFEELLTKVRRSK